MGGSPQKKIARRDVCTLIAGQLRRGEEDGIGLSFLATDEAESEEAGTEEGVGAGFGDLGAV